MKIKITCCAQCPYHYFDWRADYCNHEDNTRELNRTETSEKRPEDCPIKGKSVVLEVI